MENKKLFDVTSSEKHDVISIGKYNIILILIDCNVEMLNDNQNIYKVYYSIFDQDINNLYKNFNDYKEFNTEDRAMKYYNELKLKLYNDREENIDDLLNN